MGCHNYKHKDGKTYFIPGCMGAAVYGRERCTCYNHRGLKLTPSEMIKNLKEENETLRQEIKRLKNL